MKTTYHHIGLAKLCGWFGITRQAYYQQLNKAIKSNAEEDLLLKKVRSIREDHPRMGTRKLYYKISDFMTDHNIKMGRDALFNLLSANNMLIRNRKRRVQTTQSFHWLRKYPNLIKGFSPIKPNHLWVSDITYWKIDSGFVYISFITDAFSHKLVGYNVSKTLASIGTTRALKMALSDFLRSPESHFKLIHHSDRGVQYCYHEYVKLLQKNDIKISMTENGDPRENAVAERINGIIKGEYLKDKNVKNLKQAKNALKKAVSLYNNDRPHSSISNLSPNEVHQKNLKTKRLWKNYYKKNPTIVN